MRMRVHLRVPGRMMVFLVVVAPLLVAGVAGAYWTGSGGGGLGSGNTGTTQPVTLTPATPTDELYPGARADVVLTVANPNGSPVVITSLRLDQTRGTGGFAVDAGHAGCTTSALTYTTQTNGGTGWTVPARAGASDGILSIRLGDALAMAADSPNACQGASLTVYLAAGP